MKTFLKEHCLNKDHGVDDVRNGILMCSNHQNGFDAAMRITNLNDHNNAKILRESAFTIKKEKSKYFIYSYDDKVPGSVKRGLDITKEITGSARKNKRRGTFELPNEAFLKAHFDVCFLNVVFFRPNSKSRSSW